MNETQAMEYVIWFFIGIGVGAVIVTVMLLKGDG